MKAYTLITVFLLISCGSDDDQDTKPAEDYSGYVTDQSNADDDDEDVAYYVEIPKCTSRKEERLIYIPAEEDFLVCRDGKWMYLPLDEKPNEDNLLPVDPQPVDKPEESEVDNG